jgi:hypothetical protein
MVYILKTLKPPEKIRRRYIFLTVVFTHPNTLVAYGTHQHELLWIFRSRKVAIDFKRKLECASQNRYNVMLIHQTNRAVRNVTTSPDIAGCNTNGTYWTDQPQLTWPSHFKAKYHQIRFDRNVFKQDNRGFIGV